MAFPKLVISFPCPGCNLSRRLALDEKYREPQATATSPISAISRSEGSCKSRSLKSLKDSRAPIACSRAQPLSSRLHNLVHWDFVCPTVLRYHDGGQRFKIFSVLSRAAGKRLDSRPHVYILNSSTGE